MTAFVSFLCVALLAIPVLLTAATYLVRGKGDPGGNQRDTDVPTPAFLPAFARECGATLLVLAAGLLGRRSPAVDAPDAPLALLLPDAGLSAGAFFILRRRLRRMGWISIVGVTHRTPDRLSAAVEELDARVRRLSPRHPHIILIGHGTGGLVGRALLAGTGGSAVRQLITLGTPHQGTGAPVKRFPGFRCLAPGSSLLRGLAADADHRNGTERIAIYSEFDAWVVPVDAAYDRGAFNIQVRGVGHFSLLTSGRVFELLAENLTAAPPQVDARPPATAVSTRSTSLKSL